MKKHQALTFFLLLLYLLIACTGRNTQNETYIEPTSLSPDTTFSELNDSCFIPPHANCIDLVGDDIYLSDYNNGIMVLDKDYKLKENIGTGGQGPGEFLGASHFYTVNKDSVYITNEGKQAIELYVKGRYCKSIPFCKGVRFTDLTRFFVRENTIYHSIIGKEAPVIAFHEDSASYHLMCNYTAYDNKDLKQHSTRHIVKGDNSFYVIGCPLPILQQYAFDGKLCKEYDLIQIPEIKKEVTEYNNKKQVTNSYFMMIEDTYYRDDKLYLLIANHKKGKYYRNTICVLNTDGDEIKHMATYILKGESYRTFCIEENNKLYVHNSRDSSIEVYTMP